MEIDLFKILGLLWARRYFIVLVVAASGLLGLGSTMLMAPVFKAETQFLMQASGGKQVPSALGFSSLAGQFGLDMGGNQKIFDIFPRILESRTFLSEMKSLKVKTTLDTGKAMAEFLIPKPSPKVPFDIQLLDRLRGMIMLNKEKDGVNILTIKGRDPVFVAFLANTLVSRLENYYSTVETKKAAQNLRFLEAKHLEAKVELSSIADSIRTFKERNREINIPYLMQRLYWLQIEQRIREEKYMLLTKEYESAKIDYEKVKPIVVVVDSAIVPFSKSEPRRKIALIVSCAFGTLLSLAWIIGGEWFRRTRKP
jgi:uncharacterized protein involved in exopolysaccharide biosynthesis